MDQRIREKHATFFAAARDAVGEEPMATGGVQTIWNAFEIKLSGGFTEIPWKPIDDGSPDNNARPDGKPNDFTAAHDAVGSEEPIAMGGW